MNTPIIDPSTLTQKQREEIKREIVDVLELPEGIPNDIKQICFGQNLAILKIFGESMFEKGE